MVTKKPKGLGRGLEALLGPKVAEAASPDAQDNARNQTPSSGKAVPLAKPERSTR